MSATPPTPEQIRQHASSIIACEAFTASQRSRRLLGFLVEETLNGRGERLKGFYIACEFLGRGADFDPLVDPIVRIEIGKLRRALEHYYLTTGSNDALRIEIPKGNYQPLFLPRTAPSPAPAEAPVRDETPLFGRASLVIRPVTADAGSLTESFAAGLAQQLAAVLNLLDDVYVLSADNEDASSARFLLQIQVRSSGTRLRIAVQLEDRLQGIQVWAGSYTESADDVFALEDEIARRIANKIADPNAGEMFKALATSANARSAPSPEEIVARFNTDHMQHMLDAAWQREARVSLQNLVSMQPEYAAARAALSKALHNAYLLGDAELDAMQQALQHARHAVRLEPDSQHALAALTNACIALGEHELALQAIERTLALNSTGHSARAVAAIKLIMLGEAERAEALLREHKLAAVAAAPGTAVGLALLAWLRGEHATALAAVSRDLLSSNFWGGLVRTVSLVETDAMDAARTSLSILLQENPAFALNPQRYISVSLYRRDWQEKLLIALSKAGLKTPTASNMAYQNSPPISPT